MEASCNRGIKAIGVDEIERPDAISTACSGLSGD